jgi:hypothetical protein
MESDIKFFADDMVGRLCWWLRMIGYDTAYERDIEDDDLARRAQEEDRIVLTRDTTFAERYPDLTVLSLPTDRPEVQLWLVLRAYQLDYDHAWFSRCLVCNDELLPVHKEKYAERIPPHVLETLDEFWYCRTCDQLFWKGTHHKNMMMKLERLKERLQKMEEQRGR